LVSGNESPQKMNRNAYSVVIPTYNSAESLPVLFKGIQATLKRLHKPYEIIFVDDNSTDSSWLILEKIKRENFEVKIIKLSQNYGQMPATMCGIYHSTGNAIITIDDDLQYPLCEIRKLIEFYEKEDYLIVFGDPIKRMHGKLHEIFAHIGKLFLHYVTLPQFKEVNFFTTFRIIDRCLFFDEDNKPKSFHLFFLWELAPERCKHIDVVHQKRQFGISGNNLNKLVKHYLPFILYSLIRIINFSLIGLSLIFLIILTLTILNKTGTPVGGISDKVLLITILLIGLFLVVKYMIKRKLSRIRSAVFELEKALVNGNT